MGVERSPTRDGVGCIHDTPVRTIDSYVAASDNKRGGAEQYESLKSLNGFQV